MYVIPTKGRRGVIVLDHEERVVPTRPPLRPYIPHVAMWEEVEGVRGRSVFGGGNTYVEVEDIATCHKTEFYKEERSVRHMRDDVREVSGNVTTMNKMMGHVDAKDASITDMPWDGGMPPRSIENNYVNGRCVRHVDRERLTKLLQKEARDIMLDRLETITSPANMLTELKNRGLNVEVVQLCTGLSEESMGMLREGRRYPYLMQSWKAVFHDLGEKLNVGDAVFGTSKAIKDGDELKSLMREIYGRSGRDFTDPEDAIKYICGNGMDRGSMARMLYVGTNVLDKVLKGERMFSRTVVARINSLLREEFTI